MSSVYSLLNGVSKFLVSVLLTVAGFILMTAFNSQKPGMLFMHRTYAKSIALDVPREFHPKREKENK